MKGLDKYTISHGHLPLGDHYFYFDVDFDFFEKFEYSEIKKANVKVNITMNKTEHLLSLNFDINGSVNIECDRCLDFFDLPILYNCNLYLKFGSSSQDIKDDGDEDVLIVSKKDNTLNVSQFIYEFICISIPYRRIHSNDEKGNTLCNKEMISKINEFSTDKISN